MRNLSSEKNYLILIRNRASDLSFFTSFCLIFFVSLFVSCFLAVWLTHCLSVLCWDILFINSYIHNAGNTYCIGWIPLKRVRMLLVDIRETEQHLVCPATSLWRMSPTLMDHRRSAQNKCCFIQGKFIQLLLRYEYPIVRLCVRKQVFQWCISVQCHTVLLLIHSWVSDCLILLVGLG